MAKRSKAEIEKETSALKDAVAKARKKPLNIAMLVSKEGLAVASDLRKPTSVLMRAAKEAGGQPAKSALGTLRISGNKAELISESDKVPGQMAKLAKSWFGEHGIKLTFDIKTPSDMEEEAAPEEEEVSPAEKKKAEKAEAEREKAMKEAKEEEEEVLAKSGTEATVQEEEEEEEIQASTGGAADEDEEEEIDIEAWKERRMTIALKDDFADLEDDLDDVMDTAQKPVAKKLAGLAKMVEDNIDRDQKRAASALGLLKKTLTAAKTQAEANGGGSPADADGKLSEKAREDLMADLETFAAELEAFDAELEKEDA